MTSAGRHRVLRWAVASAALAAPLVGPSPARAADPPTFAFALTFTTARTGAPTGVSLHLVYGVPGERPPAPAHVDVAAPAGTRFHLDLPDPCTASDAEITARGPGACPDAARVGQGAFVAEAGLPTDPVLGDLDLYRTTTGLVEVVHPHGSTATVGTDRFTITGSHLTANPPQTPVGVFRQLDDHVTDTRFATTPATCPTGGHWTATAVITFTDGSVVTRTSALPCTTATTTAVTAPAPTTSASASARSASTGLATTGGGLPGIAGLVLVAAGGAMRTIRRRRTR